VERRQSITMEEMVDSNSAETSKSDPNMKEDELELGAILCTTN